MKGGGGRDRLGVDLEVKDGGLAGCARRLEGRREIRGALDALAMAAEGTRISGEVRVLQTVAETRPG